MRNLDACRHLPALADLVWSERALVERLHHKLNVARLILAADQRDMIALALAEIEDAVAALDAAEDDRLRTVALVATDWQLQVDELTLARLAEESPEPFSAMFEDHRRALGELTDSIVATVQDNQRLASSSLTAIQSSLGVLAAPAATGYDARGLASAGAVGPLRLDRSL